MRKILCLIFVVWAFLMAHARHLTPQEAQNVASELFNSPEIALKEDLSKEKIKSRADTGDPQPQPYYIFNAGENDGFAIISGDDRMKKILAYSHSGHIDLNNLPPQLQSLLDEYAMVASKLSDSAPQHKSWKSATLPTEVVDLKTARWNQWEPYNLKAPKYENGNGPIGCVATALSIIMKHNEFPKKAVKNYNHQWFSNGTAYSYDFGKMDINYSLLKDEYLPDEELSEEEADAISELLYAVAAAVNMQFTSYSSSATTEDKPHFLREVLGFSPDCQHIARVNFTDEEWNDLLKDQINNGLPVLYSGRWGLFSGHSFVLDGYDTEGYYHVNWGWGGYENGYFSIDGEMENFNEHQSMLINLKAADDPVHNNEIYSKQWIDGGTRGLGDSRFGYGKASGLTIDVESIETGVPFNATLSSVLRPSNYKGYGTIALLDESGNVVETCRDEYRDATIIEFYPDVWEQELNYGKDWTEEVKIRFSNIYFTCPIKDTYRVAYVAKDGDETAWKQVVSTLDAPGSRPVKGNVVVIPEINFTVHGDVSKVVIKESDRKYLYFDKYPLNIDVVDGIAAIYVNGKLHYYNSCYFHYDRNWITLTGDKYDVDVYYMPYSDLTEKEYHVTEPGTLSNLITDEDREKVGSVKVSGNLNAQDIEAIGNIKFIRNIDLENASFVEDGENREDFFPGMTMYVYDRDFIPPYETVKLPANLKGFEQISLNSYNMDAINIPASVETFEYGCLNRSIFGSSLTFVNLNNPVPANLDYLIKPFEGNTETKVLFVPEGSKEAYMNDELWSTLFHEIKEVSPEMPYIGEYVEDENSRYLILTDCAALVGFKGYNNIDQIKDAVEYKGKSYPVKYMVTEKLNAPEKLVLNHDIELAWNNNEANEVYSPHLTRAEGAPNKLFKVPGAGVEGHGYMGEEMYEYRIDKTKGVLKISANGDDVKLNSITINGKDMPIEDDNTYVFDKSEVPSVSVNYTLFDKHNLTTHYSKEFNAALPSSELSGIAQVEFDNNEPVQIYDLNGIKVYEGLLHNHSLNGKVYIVVQNKVAKVVYFR